MRARKPQIEADPGRIGAVCQQVASSPAVRPGRRRAFAWHGSLQVATVLFWPGRLACHNFWRCPAGWSRPRQSKFQTDLSPWEREGEKGMGIDSDKTRNGRG